MSADAVQEPQNLFEAVDRDCDHSVLHVHRPVKIMPLRRASLPKGVYLIQGDVRDKFRHVSVRRLMKAGLFDVEFVKGTKSQKVLARTQREAAPSEVAPTPAPAGAETAPDSQLPGVGPKKDEAVPELLDGLEKPRKKPSKPASVEIQEPAIAPDYVVGQKATDAVELQEIPVVLDPDDDGEAVDELTVDLGDLTALDDEEEEVESSYMPSVEKRERVRTHKR